jgi:chromosome segregation ATPase
MEKKLDSVLAKIDKLDERLDSIDKTLIKQEASLDKHIFRTEVAEKQLDILSSQIVPISKHVNQMSGALKLLGVMSLVMGIAALFKKLFF